MHSDTFDSEEAGGVIFTVDEEVVGGERVDLLLSDVVSSFTLLVALLLMVRNDGVVTKELPRNFEVSN